MYIRFLKLGHILDTKIKYTLDQNNYNINIHQCLSFRSVLSCSHPQYCRYLMVLQWFDSKTTTIKCEHLWEENIFVLKFLSSNKCLIHLKSSINIYYVNKNELVVFDILCLAKQKFLYLVLLNLYIGAKQWQKTTGINIIFSYIFYKRNIIFKHRLFRKLILNYNIHFNFETCNFRNFVSNLHIDEYIQLPCLTAYFNFNIYYIIVLCCIFRNWSISIKIIVLLQNLFCWYCIYNNLWLFSSENTFTTLVNV